MVIAFELEITFSPGQVSIFTPPVLTKERVLAAASSSSPFLPTTKGETLSPVSSRERRRKDAGTKRERERLARPNLPDQLVKGSCVVRGPTREYFAEAVE